MPATTRANVKTAVAASLAPDAAAPSETRTRPLAVQQASPLLYRLVVLLPLISLALTLLFRVHSWDVVLTQQLAVVILMSVGAYLATRHLIPLSTSFVTQPPLHPSAFAAAWPPLTTVRVPALYVKTGCSTLRTGRACRASTSTSPALKKRRHPCTPTSPYSSTPPLVHPHSRSPPLFPPPLPLSSALRLWAWCPEWCT